MPTPTRVGTFPAFVSLQLEELRSRLVSEFERLQATDLDVEGPTVCHFDLQAAKVCRFDLPDAKVSRIEVEDQKQKLLEAENLSLSDERTETNILDYDCTETPPMPDIRVLEISPDSLKLLNHSTRDSLPTKRLEEDDELEEDKTDKTDKMRHGSSTSLQQTDPQTIPVTPVSAGGGSVENSASYAAAAVWESRRPTKASETSCHWSSRSSDAYGDCEDSPRKFASRTLQWTNISVSAASDVVASKYTFAYNGVILPGSAAYRVWSHFISVIALCSCFLAPFRFGFFEGVDSIDAVGTALRIILGVDLLLNFNVAKITKKSGLVVLRWDIVREYVLSRRFLTDFLGTVPFDSIWAYFAGTGELKQEIASALGLLRMLQVIHLLNLFRELQKNTYFNLLGVVVAKFVLFILLCTHTSGCIFYKLAQYGAFGNNTWVGQLDPTLHLKPLATRYMHVLFWAVGTFKAGPASGDLSPKSNSEMLLACLTMMVNICLQTYLVSNMAALLTTTDMRIYNMRNQLTQLRDFAHRYKLPEGLHRQLRSFVRFKLSHNEEADQNILSGLPDLYRQQVSHVLFEDTVKSVDIFHDCASLFLRQLHSQFKATLYMPHQQLASIDGPSTSLQIVAEGEVELLHRNGGIMGICRTGDCFTAVSFLCKVGQPFAVRTRMICRVLSLGDAAWEAACTAFPQNLQRVKHNLLVHCKDKLSEFLPETAGFNIYLELIEVVTAHLAQQEELSVAMICSAAARGDLVDLKRRLVANTPNCSNYDCRTPLHLAAVHGQVDVCRFLLDARSKVDPVDNFGRTPLLEACRARQEEVAQMLYARGASLGSSVTKQKVSRDGTECDTAQNTEAGELCQAAADVEQLWYLRALLRYSANPNVGDYDARTALHVANASGNTAAVELLIGYKDINLNSMDNFGRTPLMEAVRHGHEACARLMRGVGAFHGFITDLKESTNPNATPAGQELCQAAFSNQVHYLHNLVTYCGINVDAADYDLRTALMLASAEGNMKVAVSLIQNKADVHRKDRWGHTAITEAEEHGHEELAKVLRLMGAHH